MKIWPIIFFLLSIEAGAQNLATESIAEVLDQTSCTELQSYATVVLDSSHFFLDNAVEKVENIIANDKSTECEAFPLVLTINGFHKYINDDILGSRNALLKADSIYKFGKSIDNRFFIRNNIFLGLNYGVDEDTLKSLQYYKIAKNIAEQIDDKRLLADVLTNMGLLYLNVNVLDRAKSIFLEAEQYCEESNNSEMMAFLNLNLSRLLRMEENWDAALEKVDKAESLFRMNNDLRNLYTVETFRGEIFLQMNANRQAIDRFNAALNLGETYEHKFLHGGIYNSLGEVYQNFDKEKSVRNFELAFKYPSQLDETEYHSIVNTLSSHYRETNDVEKFYGLVNELSAIYANRKDMLEIEFSESSKREIAIEKEKAVNQILREKNIESARNYNIILGVSIICLMLAFYAYRQLLKNKRLNMKVSEQNDTLAEQNIELKNFAYMASHDLKSPARSISSFAALLRKRISAQEDTKSLEYLNVIEKSGKDMHRLVTSLLDFSNIENTEIEFEAFNTEELFNDVLNNLYSNIQMRNAEVKLPTNLPESIFGDEAKLKIVFQNLINNAIKFVPPERIPQVSIKYQSNVDDHTFLVSDNGIGIDEKYLSKVFLMFQRLNASSEYDGSGIGLSTCKKIVLLHNGKIDVESELGKGSTFSVILPKQLKT